MSSSNNTSDSYYAREMGELVSASNAGKKRFKCDICDSTFTQKTSLKQHKLTLHTGVKPFKCDVCERAFTRKRSLTKHKCKVTTSSTTDNGGSAGIVEMQQ